MSNQVVKIKGKNYRLVQDRVKQFRSSEEYKDFSILTEMVFFDGDHLILKSSITDKKGKILSEGIASERVGSNHINTTSFAENCQTSSVGRALAFLDESLMGDSLPSAEELSGAIHSQDIIKAKLDATSTILSSIETEDQLKIIWEKNSPIWRKEFGNHYFSIIEEHKNKLKNLFQKYEKKEVELDKVA